MVLEDVIWTLVEAAVSKHPCADIVAAYGGDGREWDIIVEGGTEGGEISNIGKRGGAVDDSGGKEASWRADTHR